MRDGKDAHRSPVHRDPGRLLAVVGPLAAMFVAGCSRSSPLRSSPRLTVAPTPTAASTGKLRDLFPLLGGVPDAPSVAIERRHRGFGVPDSSEVYPLKLRSDAYAGDGVVVVGQSADLRRRTETRSVSVPRDVMQEMLWRLADVWVAERPYAFDQRTTDSYPEIDIRVALPGSPVRYFTRSPEPGNVPWGVGHAGREFVVIVNSAAVLHALNGIGPYLLADLRDEMVRKMQDEQRSPVPKP